MTDNFYTFGDFCLEIKSQDVIEPSESFDNFRHGSEPSMTFTVLKSPLPEKNGKPVQSDNRYAFYFDENRTFMFTSYPIPGKKTFVDFGCRVTGDGDNLVYIDYEKIWEKMLFEALNISDILIRNGVAIMHASHISLDGHSILFTADKQVGKSTQAALWEKHRGAVTVNGDRASIREKDGVMYACGIPFRGSSKVSLDVTQPLRCIVVLSQARENKIRRLGPAEAFRHIMGKFTFDVWNGESMSCAVDFAAKLSEMVPVFSLACLPDESAVECLERELEKLQ